MKRTWLAGFALFLVISGALLSPLPVFVGTRFAQPVAHAGFNDTLNQIYANAGINANIQSAGGTAAATSNQSNSLECGLNLICAIVEAFSEMVMYMPNLLATVSGLVMDWTIWYSVQSSTYTKFDGGAGDDGFVVAGWKLVRDFSNLLFIFALLVVAFSLILNADTGGGTGVRNGFGLNPGRTVARVIIMALLVNFSFFLGRSAIDLTNIVARGFYNNISAAPSDFTATTSISQTSALTNDGDTLGEPSTFYTNFFGIRSISLGILQKINPQQLALDSGVTATGGVSFLGIKWKTYDWSAYVLIYFLSIIIGFFNLFLTYLFASIAILFIARTIGLYIGIIVSPIAFVSYTIPWLQNKSYFGFDDWLRQFLGLALMAPIFLFFLYLSIQFVSVSFTDSGSGYLAKAAGIMIKIGVIGFLLIYAKRISKDLSGKAGAMASGIVTSVVGTTALVGATLATGGTAGVAALGRRTIANAGMNAMNRLAQSETMQRVINNPSVQAWQQRMGSQNRFARTVRRLSNPQQASTVINRAQRIANLRAMKSMDPTRYNALKTQSDQDVQRQILRRQTQEEARRRTTGVLPTSTTPNVTAVTNITRPATPVPPTDIRLQQTIAGTTPPNQQAPTNQSGGQPPNNPPNNPPTGGTSPSGPNRPPTGGGVAQRPTQQTPSGTTPTTSSGQALTMNRSGNPIAQSESRRNVPVNQTPIINTPAAVPANNPSEQNNAQMIQRQNNLTNQTKTALNKTQQGSASITATNLLSGIMSSAGLGALQYKPEGEPKKPLVDQFGKPINQVGNQQSSALVDQYGASTQKAAASSESQKKNITSAQTAQPTPVKSNDAFEALASHAEKNIQSTGNELINRMYQDNQLVNASGSTMNQLEDGIMALGKPDTFKDQRTTSEALENTLRALQNFEINPSTVTGNNQSSAQGMRAVMDELNEHMKTLGDHLTSDEHKSLAQQIKNSLEEKSTTLANAMKSK